MPSPEPGRRPSRKPKPDVDHLKAERQRVVLPLLDKVGWTATMWATKSDLNPSVTLGYLAGT